MSSTLKNQPEVLIYLLREDCGASDQEIARECGVSRHHINQIKHGHKGASPALYKQLEHLYIQFVDSGAQPPRKPYTWQAGQDRRQAARKSRQVHTPPPSQAARKSRQEYAPPPSQAARVYPHPTESRASKTPPPVVNPWRPVDTLVRSVRSTEPGQAIPYTFTGVEDI